MDTYRISAKHIPSGSIEYNVAWLVPEFLTYLKAMVATSVVGYNVVYFMEHNEEPPASWDVKYSPELLWTTVGNDLPEYLADVYPELFGPSGPVVLGDVEEAFIADERGEPSVVCRVTLKPLRLWWLAARRGLLTVNLDASNMTRDEFVENVKNEPDFRWWLAVSLVRALMLDMRRDEARAFHEMFAERIEAMIRFEVEEDVE